MSLEAAITRLPIVTVPAGEALITEGERLDRIFFLKSGRIEITRDAIRLSLIQTPGAVLGEVSVLLGVPSTATVTALDEVEAYRCDDAITFLRSHPDVSLHVSQLLAHRLAAATLYLVDVKEQLQGCSDHVGMVDGVLDSILHRDLKKKISL